MYVYFSTSIMQCVLGCECFTCDSSFELIVRSEIESSPRKGGVQSYAYGYLLPLNH